MSTSIGIDNYLYCGQLLKALMPVLMKDNSKVRIYKGRIGMFIHTRLHMHNLPSLALC